MAGSSLPPPPEPVRVKSKHKRAPVLPGTGAYFLSAELSLFGHHPIGRLLGELRPFASDGGFFPLTTLS
jgi:hypothetical protein